MSDPNPILLQTKLHRPPVSRGLIDRPRLLEQLNNGIDRPLTLVVASAGFGKTSLVSAWLERLTAAQFAGASSFPAAWLSLDENDSDLNIFIRYFIAALHTVFPESFEETLMLLQAMQPPPPAVLYATLSNEIAQLSESFILVLDDYHTIRGVEVHDLLKEWARHWPKSLHLVLISRINPPMPLAGMRAKGMVSEIRTHDLRFTAQETAVYLDQARFVHLDQPVLDLLEERFEGWIAGLHLAALSLRSTDSQEAVLSVLSGENANITGYLVDEVLIHQFPAIHTFLIKTSVLDRFCPSLCEAIIGETDNAWNVRACLDWIERSELFMAPLDNRREWYRYHHLFQELLQQRLSGEMKPDEVANLHRLASTWFEEHGLLDEALHHALAAGDLELAACQMNAGLRDVTNREDRPTLERWLRLMPEEMIRRSPGLLMIRAWTLEFLWRLNLQTQVLEQVENLLDSEKGASLQENDVQLLRGQILSLRAQQAYLGNQTARAIDLCRQALMLLPPSWTFVRGGAMFYLGMSMQASGQAQAAERLLLDDYASYVDKTDAYALLLLRSLGFIYLNSGQLEQARQIAQLVLQGATRSKVAILKNWGDWYLGVVCYLRNESEEAALYFTQIVENRYTAQVTTLRDAVAGLALIHQVNGEGSQAGQMVDLISQFDLEQRGREDARTSALRARLLLMQGDLQAAGRWADTYYTGPPPDQALLWLEEPQVTRARILVARGTKTDLQAAAQLLNALEEIAVRTHNTRYMIEILALRALALHAQGITGEANASLIRALDLSQAGGFTRVFTDLGAPMQHMLQQAAEQEPLVETIHHILAAFPEGDKNPVRGESPAQLPGGVIRHPLQANLTLIEPLTPRELEVLACLREPLSVKEIALKLHISYATAKRHTINLYSKLGVNNRWSAIARAEELNILPPR